jgi:hypothetical protein
MSILMMSLFLSAIAFLLKMHSLMLQNFDMLAMRMRMMMMTMMMRMLMMRGRMMMMMMMMMRMTMMLPNMFVLQGS